jgi:TetR/AcrR family transcriptional regulator, transcriptional repressor for nem operon
MIYAEGYAATGIQGIVESANVPKGTFYNHFPSKEAFGAEVVDAYFDRNERKLLAAFGDVDVAPLARLEAYFDERIEAFRTAGYAKGCLLGNLSAEVADHSPLVRERLAEYFNAWSRFLENCIAEAQEQGTVSNEIPAAVLGRFVLNSWEGALLRMRAEKSDASLIEFKQVVFGSILHRCSR